MISFSFEKSLLFHISAVPFLSCIASHF